MTKIISTPAAAKGVIINTAGTPKLKENKIGTKLKSTIISWVISAMHIDGKISSNERFSTENASVSYVGINFFHFSL